MANVWDYELTDFTDEPLDELDLLDEANAHKEWADHEEKIDSAFTLGLIGITEEIPQ